MTTIDSTGTPNTYRSNNSATGWNPLSTLTAGLAGLALIGRIAAFVTPGPSSVVYLLSLLGIAVLALGCAIRRESVEEFVSYPERRAVRMAKRMATVQTLMGVGLLALTIFS